MATFKERKYQCECGWTGKRLDWDHVVVPCPQCGKSADIAFVSVNLAPGVFSDSIPGGMMIKHGLCHADGTPRRYDSKTEIFAEAAKRGLCQSGNTPFGKESGYRRWV
jgi:hypothetical protein